MSRGPRKILLLAPLLLAGCASGPAEGERTVFHNPYAQSVTASQSGIGPECDTTARASDTTCLGVPLTGKGRGNTIGVPLEDGWNLTRAQRRVLRQRAELLKELGEHTAVSPPPPPPLPPLPGPAGTP